MGGFLLNRIKLLIEFHAIAGGTWLAAVAISITFLRVTRLYKFRKITISLPAILALAFEVFGMINLVSRWSESELAYYILGPPILASLFVLGYFEKRL